MAATPIDRREAERLGFRFLYKRPSVIAGRELWMVERNGLDYYLQLTPAPAPADPVLLGIGFGQDWTAEQMRIEFDPNKPPEPPAEKKPSIVQRSLFGD